MKPIRVTCRACRGTGRVDLVPSLSRILDYLRRGSATAVELRAIELKARGEAPSANAFNNRLEDLRALGYLVRRKDGRCWSYGLTQIAREAAVKEPERSESAISSEDLRDRPTTVGGAKRQGAAESRERPLDVLARAMAGKTLRVNRAGLDRIIAECELRVIPAIGVTREEVEADLAGLQEDYRALASAVTGGCALPIIQGEAPTAQGSEANDGQLVRSRDSSERRVPTTSTEHEKGRPRNRFGCSCEDPDERCVRGWCPL